MVTGASTSNGMSAPYERPVIVMALARAPVEETNRSVRRFQQPVLTASDGFTELTGSVPGPRAHRARTRVSNATTVLVITVRNGRSRSLAQVITAVTKCGNSQGGYRLSLTR